MRIAAPNCHSLRLITQWQDWQAMDILKRKLGRIGKAIYRATIRTVYGRNAGDAITTQDGRPLAVRHICVCVCCVSARTSL
jgi:hypothetical protein